MAKQIFQGHSDHYNGITIDSIEETCDTPAFVQRLKGRRILFFPRFYSNNCLKKDILLSII